MSHFVLEIGVEELPARVLASLERDLHDRFAALFAEHGLSFDELTVDTTPRRAVLHARGLLSSTPVREEVALGPSLKAAYDAEGNPTKAAMGFARGQGVDVADLFRQETPKGVYVAVRKTVGGVSASSIIAGAAPAIIAALLKPGYVNGSVPTLSIFENKPVNTAVMAFCPPSASRILSADAEHPALFISFAAVSLCHCIMPLEYCR